MALNSWDMSDDENTMSQLFTSNSSQQQLQLSNQQLPSKRPRQESATEPGTSSGGQEPEMNSSGVQEKEAEKEASNSSDQKKEAMSSGVQVQMATQPEGGSPVVVEVDPSTLDSKETHHKEQEEGEEVVMESQPLEEDTEKKETGDTESKANGEEQAGGKKWWAQWAHNAHNDDARN